MTHCRQVMLEELQRRNFAPTTISTYLHAVEQFARHFKCRPDRLNQTHFRSYQAYLLRERKMRPLTVRLHVAALRFFFVKTLKRRYLLDDTPYPKAPRRLPQILSVEEVARVIDAADSLSHRTMLMVLYSTGMRNAELRHLQVADIDSRRMLIHIQRGKGGRDRYVPLSPTLLTTLARVLPVDAAEDVAVSRDRRRLARRQAHHAEGPLGCLCRRGPPRRAPQAVLAAPHAPFVCHALAREWRGPPDDSAAARSRGGPAHGAVSPSLAEASAGRRESAGCAHDLGARHRAADAVEAQAVTRPPFEVADIVRQHGDRFLETHRAWVTGQHRRVLRAIAQCRTAALGGHRDRCEQCAQPALSYNSCRDRHCPKCLTAARNAWVAAREQELLPVGYVHIVFTMPEPLARLALRNKRVVYDLLFHAAAETLLQVAANPKRLGAAIGGLMVLHTWGQRLQHHPHVHCVVPAGGLSPDGTQWIHARPTFLPLRFRCCGRSFAASSSPACARHFATAGSSFPGSLAAAGTAERLPRVSPIALSPVVGGLRQAALWQSCPRAALPRALHPPRRHLQPPARRRDRRHRLVSVEGLSARESDPHAHARRRRVSPTLSPARAAEALRPHPLLRLPRLTLLGPAGWPTVVRRSRSPQHRRPNRSSLSPPRASWPCPRCGAPMRIVERLTARQLFLDALLADVLHDTS